MPRFTPGLAGALAALALAACGTTSNSDHANPARAASQGARTDTTAIAVTPGRPFVITLAPGELPRQGSAVAMELDRVPLVASASRVVISPWKFGTGDSAPASWLPIAGVWSAIAATARDADAASRGAVIAVAVAPQSNPIGPPAPTAPTIVGDGLLAVGVRTIPIHWTRFDASPPGTDPTQDTADWPPSLREPAARSFIDEHLDLGRDPTERWRLRLAVDGLRPGEVAAWIPRFDDPALESLACWTEDRWRESLAGLARIDPSLGRRVRETLSMTVNVGSSSPGASARCFPAWKPDRAATDGLLDDLSNQARSASARAQAAEFWLRDQPGNVAWVVDDAAGLTSDGLPIAEIAIANLSDRATLGWTSERDGSRADELKPLPAATVTALRTLPPPKTAGPAGRPVIVHAGIWEHEVTVATQAAPLTPPGLTIGPLLCDWTLSGWHAGKPDVPENEWSTAGILHKPVGPGGETKWQVFVECRLKPGVGQLNRERVYVAFGSAVAPAAVYRVGIDGRAVNELGARGGTEPVVNIPIARGPDRWSFRLDVPASAAEKSGLLRIGIARTDALGRRSAWPRPMTPWQTTPGRALLDLRAWQ